MSHDLQQQEPVRTDALEWRVHLARQRPGRAAVVVAVILVSAGLAFYLFQSLGSALLTVLVLVGATAEFLFPIRYRLDESGAELRNLHNRGRIEWKDVRKVYLSAEGIKLSPLAVRTRMEAFRGVVLRFGESADRETVLAVVRRFRDAAGCRPE